MSKSNAARAKVQRVLPALNERAVGLCVSHGLPHFTRREDGAKIVGVADEAQSAFKVSKEILKSQEYMDIGNFDNVTYWRIRNKFVLPHWFRRGEYLLPIGSIDAVEAYLLERYTEREKLIDRFMAVYDERKADAKERLGELYDEREYPDHAVLRDKFAMEWDYPPAIGGVAPALEFVKQSVWKREQERLVKKTDDAIDAVTVLLRQQIKAVVDHWVGVLGGDGDGKPKVFKSESLDKLREFLEDIKLKNICDDEALGQNADELLSVLGAADAKELRKDSAYRESILRGFEKVKSAVDKLAVDKPVRKIRF